MILCEHCGSMMAEQGEDTSGAVKCPYCTSFVFVEDTTREKFYQALEELGHLADDFSEGSQQRWMEQMRHTNELRDELWLLERREDGQA